jgi:hypothetical protein
MFGAPLNLLSPPHPTLDITGMTHAKFYLSNDQLHVGDGKGLVISNTAHNLLHISKQVFTLSNILHVPHIKKKITICSTVL